MDGEMSEGDRLARYVFLVTKAEMSNGVKTITAGGIAQLRHAFPLHW